MDTRRHAPLGRRRRQLAARRPHSRPHAYLARARRPTSDDIYASDHADARQSGRFRWLVSTCLAGAVGVLAILVVIAGSTDMQDDDGGLLPNLPSVARRLRCRRSGCRRPASTACAGQSRRPTGWSFPSGAMATKFVILDAVRQRRATATTS